ncbi:hypothetical protein IM40_05505 [Candidatus Paracaedimonas acanthamoebae]|nr:hypothetical protein IM40_05505 [Candidatus Paracaedimonas acanthamoebae]
MFNLKNQTILQILPALNQGGVERGTLDIAEGILKVGGKALVISAGGKLESQLKGIGAEHIKLPLNSKNPFTIWLNIKRIQRIIKEQNVTLVHARSRGPAWSAYYATKRLKIPFVTTFHGTYNFRSRWKRYYNSVMARGERVIAVSHFIHEHIEKNYGAYTDSKKIKIIYRGVDLNHFSPQLVSKERSEKLRKAWGLEVTDSLILMVGRLARWKGQAVLLEALKKIGDFKGICVILGSSQGHGNYLKELQASVSNTDLAHKIKFIEQCSDMPAAYSIANVVVHASTAPEAFGRVIAEAQAMGKFVIASSLGAPKEIIENGKTGSLVSPGDTLELARELVAALNLSQAKQNQIAKASRKRVQDSFSKQVMIDETLKIYTELLQKN